MFRDCFGRLVNFCHTSLCTVQWHAAPADPHCRPELALRASGKYSETHNVLSWRAQTPVHINFYLRCHFSFLFSPALCAYLAGYPFLHLNSIIYFNRLCTSALARLLYTRRLIYSSVCSGISKTEMYKNAWIYNNSIIITIVTILTHEKLKRSCYSKAFNPPKLQFYV